MWNLYGEKFHAQDPRIEGEAFVNIRAAESHLANQSLLTWKPQRAKKFKAAMRLFFSSSFIYQVAVLDPGWQAGSSAGRWSAEARLKILHRVKSL